MRRSLLLFLGASLALGTALPVAQAQQCPALRTNDIPNEIQGREILSNSAPLEFGVRLTWENPVDNKPVRVHIYRKEYGKPFVKIAQTSSGTVNSYIDKSISKTVPAYAYALRAEYQCGGMQWSEPVTVSTDRRTTDTTPPLVQFVLPQGSATVGKAEDIYIYVRDVESGIAEKTVSIKRGTTAIAAGANLGTPQHAFFKVSGASLGNKEQIKITVSNGADLKTEKALTLTAGNTGSAVTWSKPTAGGAFDPRIPLQLGWTIGDTPTPDPAKVLLSYSTNFGTDWLPLETSLGTGMTVEKPEETFKGLENTGILWLRLGYTDGARNFGTALLPLFASKTTLAFTAPDNQLATATGDIRFYDALKNTRITFPSPTPYIHEKDTSLLKLKDEMLVVALKPGFYGLEEALDNFILPTTLPANTTPLFLPGNTRIQLPIYSYNVYVSERQPLSTLGEMIISGVVESPELQTAQAAYQERQKVTEVAPVTLTEDTNESIALQIRTHSCDREAQCLVHNYTGLSPVKLFWNSALNAFANSTGSGKTIASSPIYLDSFAIETENLSLHIPDKLMESIVWSPNEEFVIMKTTTGIRWNLPERFVNVIDDVTGFLKVSMPLAAGQSCTQVLLQRRDVTGNVVPIPTLCAPGRVVGILLPFTQTELQHITPTGDLAVLTGDAWYVPYMNQFQLWGMLYQKDDLSMPGEAISRGELAYLLQKAFQYPTGTYQAGSTAYIDLPASHPLAPYILGMVAQNVMSGDSGQLTIRPDDTVNRAEALKMILSAGHLQSTNLPPHLFTGALLDYTDVPSTSWFSTYVHRATTLQIVNGSMENNLRVFRPEASVNRAEALKMIYGALQKKALE